MTTLVSCYCEPQKYTQNWQLHALFSSYLDLNLEDTHFLVSVPPGTQMHLDERVPFRIIEPIHAQFVHQPHFAAGYPFVNHFLAAMDLPTGYDHVLLTDCDTVLTARFADFTPRNFAVGSGDYASAEAQRRLKAFCNRNGYARYGRLHNIGPTWYGKASLVSLCATEAIDVVRLLLEQEEWPDLPWPQWWVGIMTMYASEIVLSEYVDDLTCDKGLLDGHCRSEDDGKAIHLHMWHTNNADTHFSKHAFDRGRYDYRSPRFTGNAATLLSYARRGRSIAKHIRRVRSRKDTALRFAHESEALLLSTRPYPDSDAERRLRDSISPDFHWHAFLRLAYEHGLAPLIYWNFRRASIEPDDRRVSMQLAASFRYSAARYLRQLGELLKILDVLNAKGIQAIPLKGPVLAEALYPHPALRPFGDLDILIDERSLRRARDLLLTRGYEPRERWMPDQSYFMRFFHHYTMSNEKAGSTVELHWSVDPPSIRPRFTLNDLLMQCEPVRLGNDHVPGFPAELSLLLLCRHGARHAWSSLLQICDVAALIAAHPALQWDRLLDHARQHRSERMLLLGVAMAKQSLGSRLPREVLRAIESDAGIMRMAFKLRQQLFVTDPVSYNMSAKVSKNIWQLQMQGSAGCKLRYSFDKGMLCIGRSQIFYELYRRVNVARRFSNF